MCTDARKAEGVSCIALRMPRPPKLNWKCALGPCCFIKADVDDGAKNFSELIIIAALKCG